MRSAVLSAIIGIIFLGSHPGFASSGLGGMRPIGPSPPWRGQPKYVVWPAAATGLLIGVPVFLTSPVVCAPMGAVRRAVVNRNSPGFIELTVSCMVDAGYLSFYGVSTVFSAALFAVAKTVELVSGDHASRDTK